MYTTDHELCQRLTGDAGLTGGEPCLRNRTKPAPEGAGAGGVAACVDGSCPVRSRRVSCVAARVKRERVARSGIQYPQRRSHGAAMVAAQITEGGTMTIRDQVVVVTAILGGSILSTAGARLLQPRMGAAHAQSASVAAPSSTKGGRYQIIFNPSGVREDTFLLDTQTGKIWTPTKYTNVVGEPTAWVYEDRIDTDAQLAAWTSGFKLKP